MTIACKNLQLIRNEIPICEELNIEINFGEVVNVTGKNGAGKTTFLKVLAGFNTQYTGECFLSEESTFLPDYPVVDDDLTVEQNINFWSSVFGAKGKVKATVKLLQLDDKLHLFVHQLSKGWVARVNLTKILLSNSRVLILDEPFANLDAEGKELISNIMQARAENRGIVIFSSQSKHIMQNARIIELHG